jgi:signal transduction histidine kinase
MLSQTTLPELLQLLIPLIPYITISLYPMWETQYAKWRTIVFCFLCYSVYFGGIFFLMTRNGSLDFRNLQMLKLYATLPYNIIPFIIFRHREWQNIFLFSINSLYYCIYNGAGLYAVEDHLFPSLHPLAGGIIVCFGVIALTLPPLLLLLRRLYRNAHGSSGSVFWQLMWLVPTLYFLLFLATGDQLDSSYYTGKNVIAIRIILYSALLLTCILLNIALKQVSATEAARRREQSAKMEKDALEKLNHMKTNFLQDMNHELRTPLAIISAGITYAEGEIGPDGNLEKACGALGDAKSETLRIGRMLDGMAEIAEMNEVAENRQRTNLAVLLGNSAEAYRLPMEIHGVGLHVDLPKDMPDVYVETDKFTVVMHNLLSNAMAYTKEGTISVTSLWDASNITVCISDTGRGIDPSLLPHVFERGVSGRGGTGYGLGICKAIIEAHGGTIAVANNIDVGATITFTVPVYGGQEAGHSL